MIFGYIAIGLSIALVIIMMVFKDLKPNNYYLAIYFIGAMMLLSTTTCSTQLVGSDIHLEYYYARLALLNGWDHTLPCTINSCLPVVWLAPLLTGVGGETNIDGLMIVFKITFPLLYAFVPVFLLWIYSRFMPIKWAFLSAFVFIMVPVFFLEMPQVSRQMIAELIVVAMAALLISNVKHEYKMGGLLLGSLGVVASHYATATFWLVFLIATFVSYAIKNHKDHLWQWLDIGVIGCITVGVFYWYSHWAGGGWQVVDYSNTINSVIASGGIVQSAPAPLSDNSVLTGATWKFNINYILIALTLAVSYGTYRMVKSKIPQLYKAWVITAFMLLIVAIVYPSIGNTINYTRYFHMMLIFLAPAVVHTFTKYTTQLVTVGVMVAFVFSSGLVFNLAHIDSIDKANIPYSIALENQRLDAGNYLTENDSKVACWAYENEYELIYGDIGGTLIAQDYYGLYKALPLKASYEPKEIIIVREWNTEHGWAKWVGPGLRRTEAMVLPEGNKVYESGSAYIWEVK